MSPEVAIIEAAKSTKSERDFDCRGKTHGMCTPRFNGNTSSFFFWGHKKIARTPDSVLFPQSGAWKPSAAGSSVMRLLDRLSFLSFGAVQQASTTHTDDYSLGAGAGDSAGTHPHSLVVVCGEDCACRSAEIRTGQGAEHAPERAGACINSQPRISTAIRSCSSPRAAQSSSGL